MKKPMKRDLKSLTILGAVAASAVLAGCAAPRQQAYAPARPVNPYEWHTVSVTPVPPGSRVVAGSTPRVEYTTEEIRPVPQRVEQRVEYTSQPYPAYPAYPASSVYVAPPVYAPAPVYYYPAVTIGLDFVFGNWGHRRHHHGRRR